jgi:FkbM family methyltransferase
MIDLFLAPVKLLIGTGIGRIPFVAKVYQTIIPRLLTKKEKIIDFGSFKILVITGRRISNVATGLLFKHQYEPATSGVFKKLLSPGDRVIDVGANIGYFSLLAASLVGDKGYVYAFEPELSNTLALKQNMELNKFKNIYIHQVAVSDKSGKAVFHVAIEDSGHSLVKTKEHSSSIVVDIDKLDNIIQGEVRLLKTDTEGNELSVLKGAESVIKRSGKICLIMEVFFDVMDAGGYTINELWDYLESVGMKFFYTINDRKETVTRCYSAQDVSDICKNHCLYINLLCMKEEM